MQDLSLKKKLQREKKKQKGRRNKKKLRQAKKLKRVQRKKRRKLKKRLRKKRRKQVYNNYFLEFTCLILNKIKQFVYIQFKTCNRIFYFKISYNFMMHFTDNTNFFFAYHD